MGLFGFGKKKKEESTPACACQCGCPTAEVDVSEVAKEAGSTADGALSIKVLGAGCASCHALLESTKEAVAKLGLGVEVEYVTDMTKIAGYGVMSVPALVVNEKVVTMGKVLKANEVETLLNKLGVAQPAAASCCSCGGACGTQSDAASILILGPGCKNCQALEANTRAALEQIGDTTSAIGHVTDFSEIAKYGIMSTPGLVVDGKVVSYGKVLKPEDIVTILKKVRG
nr:thioredoxin family protein [uncultured Gemmiger sp.]